MGKGKDAKKSVKKEALLTPKEKKAAKKAKKAGYLSQSTQVFYASFIDNFYRTYKKGQAIYMDLSLFLTRTQMLDDYILCT